MNDINKGRVALERQMSNNDVAKALMNKFVAPAPQSRLYNTRDAEGANGRFGLVVPDQMTMNTVTRATATNIEDNKNILELFPELKRVMQIYVAALTNPNDLKTVEMFIDSEDFPGRVAEIVQPMIDTIDTHFKNIYKIKTLIPRIIEDVFFIKGSYNFVVLPESTLDRAINGNGQLKLEEYGFKDNHFASWGLLGNDSRKRHENQLPATVSMEDYFSGINETIPYDPVVRIDSIKFTNTLLRDKDGKFIEAKIDIPDMVTVVDNPDILRMPILHQRRAATAVQRALRANTLGGSGLVTLSGDPTLTANRRELTQEQVNEIWNKLNIQRHTKVSPVYALATPDTLDRQSVGHPGVMHVPPEALEPVHAPGDPENHIGYLVQLDEFGYPVRLVEDAAYYKQLESRLSKITADIAGTSSNGMASEMIGAAKNMIQGTSCNQVDMSAFVSSYESLMQRYIVERIVNGYLGSAVEIGATSSFYLSMLARSLAHKQTRVLFIPREMVTYIAYEYNKYGIGRSLLESTKMISSQRAMLMVQELMAKIKSSLNYTTLSVMLEDTDRNPVDTVEQALHSFARVYQSGFPLGETNPMDIINAYERSSIRLKVEGNNPRFPKLNTDVSVEQRNYQSPDNELMDRYRRDHFMGLGVSPEIIDTSYQSEFAASVITANAMQEKQFTVCREVITNGLTDHIKKYTAYSPVLLTSLRNTVRANMSKLSQAQLKQLFGSDFENGVIRNVNAYQEIDDQSATMDLDYTKPEVQEVIADAYVSMFLNSLQVRLPDSNARRLEDQVREYNQYKEAITAQLDDYLTPDYVMGLGGVDETTLQMIRACIIGTAMRTWAKENNFNQELADLFSLDDKKNAVQDWKRASMEHIEIMGKCMGDFALYIQNLTKKIEEKMGAQAQDGSVSSDGSWSSDSGSDTGSSDDFGGGDDFGDTDFDTETMEETSTEETTTSEDTTTDTTSEDDTSGDIV
ncbi:hypothetical protein EJO52_23690 [Salmonella enterica subsp. enterica serovar Enteritidis]|nr:hypothetical protein [Salmonella enterica subsp. enterica serovar Enteritidis]